MNRWSLLLLALLSPLSNASEVDVDKRCFTNESGKIKLEFRVYNDADIGWVGGQVRYYQSKTFIPLVYQGTETLMEVEDRPWEFQHTWLEVLDGAITGKYQMVSQGAVIYRLTYTSQKTGKTVDISNNDLANAEGKCPWEE